MMLRGYSAMCVTWEAQQQFDRDNPVKMTRWRWRYRKWFNWCSGLIRWDLEVMAMQVEFQILKGLGQALGEGVYKMVTGRMA